MQIWDSYTPTTLLYSTPMISNPMSYMEGISGGCATSFSVFHPTIELPLDELLGEEYDGEDDRTANAPIAQPKEDGDVVMRYVPTLNRSQLHKSLLTPTHTHNRTPHLILHLHGGMQIFFKTLMGKTITLEVSCPTLVIFLLPVLSLNLSLAVAPYFPLACRSKMDSISLGLQHPEGVYPSSGLTSPQRHADLCQDPHREDHHIGGESSDLHHPLSPGAQLLPPLSVSALSRSLLPLVVSLIELPPALPI
jgi:hypothetical protein